MESWGKNVKDVYDHATKVMQDPPDTLVILSGGMDSATCLALARYTKPKRLATITFEYGQKHSNETEQAMQISDHFGVHCEVISLGKLADHFVTALGKNSDLDIPKDHISGVPNTYVPYRNTIMLAIAAGYAESWGYDQIIYGANIVDYSGYPDCRPEYIDEMNDVLRIHNGTQFIAAPIVFLTKTDIVRLGQKLGTPWELTTSCYRGGQKACGKCPSCKYRLMGFAGAQITDPIAYE